MNNNIKNDKKTIPEEHLCNNDLPHKRNYQGRSQDRSSDEYDRDQDEQDQDDQDQDDQ